MYLYHWFLQHFGTLTCQSLGSQAGLFYPSFPGFLNLVSWKRLETLFFPQRLQCHETSKVPKFKVHFHRF